MNKISLVYSNNKISVNIDLFINDVNEIEKYLPKINGIIFNNFDDYKLIDIKTDLDKELIEALIRSFQYGV